MPLCGNICPGNYLLQPCPLSVLNAERPPPIPDPQPRSCITAEASQWPPGSTLIHPPNGSQGSF